MHRSTDQKTGRSDRAHRCRRHRVVPEMHAIGATGERDIETIVDHHTRPRSPSSARTKSRDDGGQLRGLEIAFANLNEVDSGLDGPLRLLDETPAMRPRSRRPRDTTDGDRSRGIASASHRPSGAVAKRDARAVACAQHNGQFGEPDDQVHDTQAADAAAHEVVGHESREPAAMRRSSWLPRSRTTAARAAEGPPRERRRRRQAGGSGCYPRA